LPINCEAVSFRVVSEFVNQETAEQTQKMRRIAALTTAALFGGLVGIGALLAIVVARTENTLPPLRPSDFYRARQQWEAHPLLNYNIEVAVTGRQAATYEVEVRDGEVVTAKRDGVALTRHRTFDTWSIPGMFTTIHSDVANVERHEAGTAETQTPQLQLRGLFDKRYGFPRRYHRTELKKWGPNQEVMWEVERFEIVGK